MTDKKPEEKKRTTMFAWLETGKVPVLEVNDDELRKWAKNGPHTDFSTFKVE
jgi:hypothetical protein